jgi:hypothetical protein
MMKRDLIYGTLLSILLFCTVSFITVLMCINSPLNRISEIYELKIGFPFIYYSEVMVECPNPNSTWRIDYLFLDCSIVWILVQAIIIFFRKPDKKTRHNNA